jgi:cobalt-zinc-cadmium efflux system outer membrane protein
MKKILMTAAGLIAFVPFALPCQQTVTRREAVASAVSRGGRLAVAIADTSAARAVLLSARALQNPSFSAAYSKSTPQLHFNIDLPIDLPGLRSARIASATAVARAADYLFTYEKAAAALDADTIYTRVLAASAHSRLSQSNALVSDTLLQMAIARRDAGDASDLEVELARVNAGQMHDLATVDSVDLNNTLIDLQTAMGVISTEALITPSDTLALPDSISSPSARGIPLQVAAGQQSVMAAEGTLKAEHRSVFGTPSIMAGIETHEPGGTGDEILPTFGFTIPVPLLNRNKGGIAKANAELRRARAQLSVTQIEYSAALTKMQRQRATALARAARDRILLESANRVASMSVVAYREGEFPLSNVLEAQRSARDVLRQYIDDVADAWNADAALGVLTLTSGK